MRRSILLLAIATLAACDGTDTIVPADRVIATGTYAYEGRWLHPETLEWDTIRGELVLTDATPDSVHGSWTVGGFRSDPTAGYWNENAYVLVAESVNGARVLTHRLSRIGAPSELQCALSFREERNNEDPLQTSGTCDMERAP